MNLKWYILIIITTIFFGCSDHTENNTEANQKEKRKPVFDPDTINWGESPIDSLIVRLSLPVHDTDRVNTLNDLAWKISFQNTDSAIEFNMQALQLSEKNGYEEGVSQSYIQLGAFYVDKGQIPLAMDYYNKCLQILDRTKVRLLENKSGYHDTTEIQRKRAGIYGNMSQALRKQGDIVEAMDLSLKSVKIIEQLNDSSHLAGKYYSIADIYLDLANAATDTSFRNKELQNAVLYYRKAMHLDEKLNFRLGIGYDLSAIANVYYQQDKPDSAFAFYLQALKIDEEIENKDGIARHLGNLGNIYTDRVRKETDPIKKEKLVDTAMDYYTRSLRIREELGNNYYISIQLGNIGTFLMELERYRESELYLLKSLKSDEKMKRMDGIRNRHKNLSDLYTKLGQWQKAYKHYVLFTKYKDSLFNENKSKDIGRLEAKADYDKQEAVAKAQHEKELEKEKAVSSADKKRQHTIIISVSIVLGLVVLFFVFLYNRFRLIRKQKGIIESQKEEVERQKELVDEKQKEIIDSITYARRLQQAILAPVSEIKKHFPDSFLLYKPKDIVAGDFYFFETTGTHIFYAAADCTGHGVPGAMVSIVCSNALTRCVKEFGLTDPGKILDKTRELILETFQKSGEDVKDGMDISLLSIACRAESEKGNRNSPLSFSVLALQWAGANNPLWYIENGEMKEIKADKQPIGKTDHLKPFTTHSLASLPHGSCLFLFTDGYPDQFGGPKGKKFKYANLQKLLLENNNLELEILSLKLGETFESWKGDLEQVDDVCIIGIKI